MSRKINVNVALVGEDHVVVTEKLQKGLQEARLASVAGRYDNLRPVFNVITKGKVLHFIVNMPGSGDNDEDTEMYRLISDMLEFSGIRKWPESSSKDLSDLITSIRKNISDRYKKIPENRLAYLTRDFLETVYGYRDLAHLDAFGVVTIGQEAYNHGLPDKAIWPKKERPDVYIERGGKKYKALTYEEICYNAKVHYMDGMFLKRGAHPVYGRKKVTKVSEDIFTYLNGRLVFISKGTYLAFSIPDDTYYDEHFFNDLNRFHIGNEFEIYTPEEFKRDLEVVDQ